MNGTAVYYRPLETCRSFVARGTIIDVSVHWGNRVWVKILPDDTSKCARWYLHSDTVVSYIWL